MKSDSIQKHIYLVGFSGSGKSTLGPRLAARLGYGFVDLDDLIESKAKKKISQIFAERGERYFRKLESDQIAAFSRQTRPYVVALGGGAFERTSNRKILLSTGIVVYFSCSIKELTRRMIKHDDRPMLKESKNRTSRTLQKKISALLTKRRPNYMMAHIRVATTDRTEADALRAVLRKIKRYANR